MPALDRNLLHRFGLLFVILLVGLALSLTTDTFLSVANFTNVARQVSINGILAVGVMPMGGTPEELGRRVAAERTKWGDIMRKANIVLE